MSTKQEYDITIEKAKKGDRNAFEQLVRENEKMVYNIAYRMMKQAEDAKDISQEAFIKAFQNIQKFDGRASFSTWIYRIVVNACLDELRKRKEKQTVYIEEESQMDDNTMKKQYEAKEETPEEDYLKKERYQELLDTMEQLSPEHKSILVLRDLQGFSYEEIANVTEISLGTVKSRLARARKQLKTEILKKRELFEKQSRHTARKGEELNEM